MLLVSQAVHIWLINNSDLLELKACFTGQSIPAGNENHSG